jgi:outer membrane protein TolC
LSFFINYWSPGISGDQILYQNGNALSGVVIGTIPGDAADSLRDAFNFKYQNWTVGLTLDLPISSLITRAQYAQARVSLDQAKIKMEDQKQQIILEIKTALRAVETNRLRVEAYRAARELAEKKLAAEEEKFKVGKSTDYQLLQYQRDVGDARTTELRSMVDFILSSAYLDKVLGTTLETKNIRLSGDGLAKLRLSESR